MWIHTLPLARDGLISKGSNWVKDPTAKNTPIPGHRYEGTITYFNVNDVFMWGCGDGEPFDENTCEEFERSLDECKGKYGIAVVLCASRSRQMRPQGAYYTYIPKELWYLFDACGPEREKGFGNPYKPGEYHPEEQVTL